MRNFRYILFVLCAMGWACSTEPLQSVSALESDLPTRRYLATGDSVAFGFNPLVDPSDASNFVGYPEQVGRDLGFQVTTNTACPGETSGSFLSASAPDNGCRSFKSRFPLHDGTYTITQIERDLGYLAATHPKTDVITVMLGANDLLLLRLACAGQLNPVACISGRLPATLNQVGANLTAIFTEFTRAPRFEGQLVAVQYYSTNYNDLLETGLVAALNQVIAAVAAAFHARVADGFTPFFQASAAFGHDPCAAGLLIALPSGGCDIHPSPAGRNLLATAVESVLN
jgi:lysophospholipase L1-like esterase